MIMAMFFVFASCSKTDESLSGTKWVAAYLNNSTLVIEFTSDTQFQEYMADQNGNVASTGVDYGIYTCSKDTIRFITHTSTSPFDFATINGNILNLTYKTGYQRSFIKK